MHAVYEEREVQFSRPVTETQTMGEAIVLQVALTWLS